MRISFVLPDASMAGGTRVVSIYAAELKRRGHDVIVISLPLWKSSVLQKFKRLLKGDFQFKNLRPPSHFDGLDVDHRILDAWRPVTNQDLPDADVVIATWWETAEWVAALGPKKGAKVYFVQHHEVFSYLPVDRCRATYRLPMHKIVISRWLKEVMASEYDDDIVDLVPNSVDHTQFFAGPRKKQAVPTVGFLYSSTTFKGVDLMLEAVRIVASKFPDLRIISFGSEPVGQNLPLPMRAQFSFNPRQDDIRNLYSECDVWASASRTEGFNLPAMEAMACATPVVSTRTGWPAEAIRTGWNGVLVDIEDVAGLAQGIEWVLSQNGERWSALSANAFATVEKSSWKKSVILFERALEHARKRGADREIARWGAGTVNAVFGDGKH